MAAAVQPFVFNTPDIASALISGGADGSYFQQHLTDSEFAEKFSSSSMERDTDFFGFDSHSSEQPLFPTDLSQPPMPKPLTPPSMADQCKYVFMSSSQPLQVDTSKYMGQARLQHGQYTPLDDQSPQSDELSSPAMTSGVPIKQEPGEVSQTSLPKRKRSSVDASQPSQKRRRSRKSSAETDSSAPVEDDKRNKFLERNRVAASKCRQKKKEWTQNLEVQARELQANKNQLQLLVSSLKDEVMWLKNEMLKHNNCGCHHIREYLSREAESIATGTRNPAMSATRPLTRDSGSSHHHDASIRHIEADRRGSMSSHSDSSVIDSQDGLSFTEASHDNDDGGTEMVD